MKNINIDFWNFVLYVSIFIIYQSSIIIYQYKFLVKKKGLKKICLKGTVRNRLLDFVTILMSFWWTK